MVYPIVKGGAVLLIATNVGSERDRPRTPHHHGLRRRHDAHMRSCLPELMNRASHARHPMVRKPLGHAFGNGLSTSSSCWPSCDGTRGNDRL